MKLNWLKIHFLIKTEYQIASSITESVVVPFGGRKTSPCTSSVVQFTNTIQNKFNNCFDMCQSHKIYVSVTQNQTFSDTFFACKNNN